MRTILIDTTEKRFIKENITIKPLFYPFTADKEVVFLDKLKPEDAARIIYSTLRSMEWLGQEWQLIIIMDLSPSGYTELVSQTKSARAELWNSYLVQELNRMQDTRVNRVVLLFLDGVERRDGKIPAREVDCCRFQLDSQGYLERNQECPEDRNCFFSVDDFSLFSEMWSQEIDLSNVSQNNGSGNLEMPDEIRGVLQKFSQEALKQIEQLIKEKIGRLPEEEDPFSDLCKKRLKNIQQKFKGEIEEIESIPLDTLRSYSPKERLRDIVGEIFSLEGQLKKSCITSIRIVLPEYEHGKPLKMLEIASIILAIIDAGNRLRLTNSNRQLLCKVELNHEYLQQQMRQYRVELSSSLERLKKKQSDGENFFFLEGCGVFFTAESFSFPINEELSSLQDWKVSFEQAEEALEKYQRNTAERENVYLREIGQNWQESQKTEKSSLTKAEEELEGNRQQCFCNIVESSYVASSAILLLEKKKEKLMTQVRYYFRKLANKVSFYWIAVSVLAIFIIPLLLLVAYHSHVSFSFVDWQLWCFPLMWFSLFFMPVVILFFKHKKNKKELKNIFFMLLNDVERTVRNTTDKNGKFLENICELMLNGRNKERLDNKKKKEKSRQKRVAHLEDCIKQQSNWTKEFIEKNDSEQYFESNEEGSSNSIDDSKPFEIQPLSFIKRGRYLSTYKVENCGSNEDIETVRFMAINALKLTPD